MCLEIDLKQLPKFPANVFFFSIKIVKYLDFFFVLEFVFFCFVVL